ncbi:MAG: thioesterase family protein [Solirubrobacterales bacterium]|nr:thioesterase family protein [Solirubrobacterales bacterium]
MSGKSATATRLPAKSAFYEPDGEGFAATELTRGPWDPSAQHAGPPAALIGRAIERLDGVGAGPGDRVVGRVTFEILAPVPIGPMRVAAEVVRPGRRVDMAEATLADGDGRPLMRARAWRLLRREVGIPSGLAARDHPPPPAPDRLEPADAFFPTGHDVGYHTAMEYRFARGSFVEPGPGVVWMRMGHPLVAGEDPTPLQRVLVVADSGNGISAALDYRRFLFINVDLSVHLSRMPEGEWVCLDAVTVPEPTGVGLTDTVLRDERGPIGIAAQTLLIAER